MTLIFCNKQVSIIIMEKEFDKKHFALRIKEIRKSKGLTQEEICDLTGIEVSNYSKIETGKVSPSMSSLQKLIKHAGFVPNEIFDYNSLDTEEGLKEMIFKMYDTFTFSQKKLLYKIMRGIEEYK